MASIIRYNLFFKEDRGSSTYAEDRIHHQYSFDNFGHILEEKLSNKQNNVTSVCSADIDGDGDNDLIVGLELGRVVIFENKIPQKNNQ